MTSTIIVAICAIVLLVLALCTLCSCSYKSVEDKENAIRGLVSLMVGTVFATIVITTKEEDVKIDTTYTYILNRK